MNRRSCRVLMLVLFMFVGGMVSTVTAATLWYNGNLDYSGNYPSSQHVYKDYGSQGHFSSDAVAYDDFIVPAGGWTVDSVWSNTLFTDGVVFGGASFEIRSGVTAGNGGAVVASGAATGIKTATGRSDGALDEYEIRISGLNIELTPGTYWLSVTPSIDLADEYSYNSTTSGTNAVGSPPGNDGNSFWDGHEHYAYGGEYNRNFEATGDRDYSMGIAGTPTSTVPLPGALWLLGSGLLGLAGIRRKKS